MNPTDIIPLLTGPAAALAVLIWVVWMQRQEINDLRGANEKLTQALADERKAVNETASAGAVTGRLIGAIVDLAAARQGVTPPRTLPPGITPESIGLTEPGTP